jgi:hypothetical protein
MENECVVAIGSRELLMVVETFVAIVGMASFGTHVETPASTVCKSLGTRLLT